MGEGEREGVGELPGTVGDLWLKGVVRADRQPIMSESSQGKSYIIKEYIFATIILQMYIYTSNSPLYLFFNNPQL